MPRPCSAAAAPVGPLVEFGVTEAAVAGTITGVGVAVHRWWLVA